MERLDACPQCEKPLTSPADFDDRGRCSNDECKFDFTDQGKIITYVNVLRRNLVKHYARIQELEKGVCDPSHECESSKTWRRLADDYALKITKVNERSVEFKAIAYDLLMILLDGDCVECGAEEHASIECEAEGSRDAHAQGCRVEMLRNRLNALAESKII